MQRHRKGDLEWLEFDLLSGIPKLRHAIFLRHGGYSQGAFSSLNYSFQVGDSAENVTRNRQLIQETLQLPFLSSARQVHGCDIAKIDSISSQVDQECDGIMTNSLNIGLVVTHADCQAALFYDPFNRAIANVHSGWRGNVQNIYQKTVNAMSSTFGTNPADLLVGISPSLGPDCAEFINYRDELPREFWDFQVKPNYFDFWAISESQLVSAGVLPHHIEIAKIDTYANRQDFYSYRRDKVTGRHGSCLVMEF